MFEIFGVPICKDKVNLDLINISSKKTSPTFMSNLETTILEKVDLPEDTKNYLLNIFYKNIDSVGLKKYRLEIANIWENFYKPGDFQEKHIHPDAQFSFIIYNNMNKSHTVLIRPGAYIAECVLWNEWFSNEFKVNCVKGDIIIFPSFLEHMVTKVNEHASTIAGNIRVFKNE